MQPASPERKPASAGARRRFRFEAAGGLVQAQIRKAGEARGFAVTRVLTHWAELAGPELARLCRPQRVSYARGGFGATLVVETPGAAAPMVQMRLEALRERINAAYGYAAITRIQLVRGAALRGMVEAQAPFAAPLRSDNLAPPAPAAMARARGVVEGLAESVTQGVSDTGLKAALELLALNIFHRGRRGPATAQIHGKDDE